VGEGLGVDVFVGVGVDVLIITRESSMVEQLLINTTRTTSDRAAAGLPFALINPSQDVLIPGFNLLIIILCYLSEQAERCK